MSLLPISIAGLLFSSPAPAQDHAAGVDQRGDLAMGFAHTATEHHFTLTKTGGVIAASAKDAQDDASKQAIVRHFRHIAEAFKSGDFEMPMFIHGRVPPGVPELKRLRERIDYRVEPTDSGARIVITTSNAKALDALHRFLRFQIEDHRTGDSTDIAP